jgi:hypothetical protein
MRTHRLTAAIASLFLLSSPALAMAMPSDTADQRAAAPAASVTGDTKFDLGSGSVAAPKAGDTKFDLGSGSVAAPTAGDTKFDAPGASRAPVYDPPTTIQVVRPERTIVRDVDEELPVILAALALLIAVGGAGFALVRTRRIALGR